MISENFIYLAAAIAVLGSVSYFLDTLKGKTKPNRVTWLLWAIAPMIVFFSQLDVGVGMESIFTLAITLSPLMIFLASFWDKKAYWKLTKFDYICGILAAIGIILWQITDNALYGLLFSLLADLFAAVPTVRKSFTHPHTENYHTFIAGSISALITLLTLNSWDLFSAAFPIYIFGINTLIAFLILSRGR